MINKLMAFSLLAASSLFIQPIKNSILPGYQTSDIEHLNPAFKERAVKVLDDLSDMGYDVEIRATYRDSDYQDFIYGLSKISERIFKRKITSVRGGKSRHNRIHNGEPGSCAMDISPRGLSIEREAEFYKELIDISRNRGLRTGGRFKKTNPEWAKYNLGWDPGHVYMSWGSCIVS